MNQQGSPWRLVLTQRAIPLIALGLSMAVATIFAVLGAEVAILVMASIVLLAAFAAFPRAALYVILILSPYYFIINNLLTSGRLGVETRFSPIDVLTVVAVGAIAIRRMAITRQPLRLTALDALAATWLFLAAVSLFHGISMNYEAAFRAARGPLLHVLYFVAANQLRDDRSVKNVTNVIVIGSIAVGVVGITGSLGLLTPLFPDLTVGLVGGIFTRPNFFVEPALAIPHLVLVFLVMRQIPASERPRTIWLVLSASTNTALLMFSVTRGFWVGFLVALLVAIWFLQQRGGFRFSSALRVGAIVVLLVFVVEVAVQVTQGVSLLASLLERWQDVVAGSDPQSVNYRLAETQAYWRSFLRAPIIGQGFGSQVLFELGTNVGFAHNQYIWVLETTGIVGAAVLAALLVIVCRRALLNLVRIAPNTLTWALQVLLLATITGFAVTSLTSPEFTNPTTVPLLACLMGIARSAGNAAQVAPRSPKTRAQKQRWQQR